jgi:hypothetical protein
MIGLYNRQQQACRGDLTGKSHRFMTTYHLDTPVIPASYRWQHSFQGLLLNLRHTYAYKYAPKRPIEDSQILHLL